MNSDKTKTPEERVDKNEQRSGEPSLFQLIEAFQEPAYLLSEAGNIVFANSAAHGSFDRPPSWLHSVVKSPKSKSFQRYCVTCHIELDDLRLLLVLPFSQQKHIVTKGRPASLLGGLPPSLAQVAKLLLMGMSDKEIARCTELTVASVRTYTGRIYRRVGVTGRQELLALALAEQDAIPPTPTPSPIPTSSQ